ncbi:MAG: hypothetical protein EHM42_07645, partial [Planctomycetaceae bacterium]
MDQLLLILRKPASRPPAARPLARVLCELPLMVRDAVAAALGPGRALRGRGPAWLAEAADVRLESLEPSEPTHHAVGLSAVPLGRVAQQHYAQKSLFPELLPDPLDTGLDVLGDCLRSLNQNDGEGWPVPDSLCVRLLRLTKVLGPTSELAGF